MIFATKADGAAVNGIALHAVVLHVTPERREMAEQGDVPDPAWSHTDAFGHFHAWDADGRLPTLVPVRVQMPCDGTCGGVCGGDGYTATKHKCVICSREVEPGYRRGFPLAAAPVGPTPIRAEVTGPSSLAAFDGDVVSLVCEFGFGNGRLSVREVTLSGGGGDAAVCLVDLAGGLYRRPVVQRDTRRASLMEAALTGAVRGPWKALSEAERAEFLRDLATAAANRAVAAALPHLGLDENGEVSP